MSTEASSLNWIMVLDDDSDWLVAMSMALSEAGFRVVQSRKALEALAKTRNQQFACILVDLDLGSGGNGEDVIKVMRQNKADPNHKTPILLLSGTLDTGALGRLKGDINGALVKPCPLSTLVQKVKDLIPAA